MDTYVVGSDQINKVKKLDGRFVSDKDTLKELFFGMSQEEIELDYKRWLRREEKALIELSERRDIIKIIKRRDRKKAINQFLVLLHSPWYLDVHKEMNEISKHIREFLLTSSGLTLFQETEGEEPFKDIEYNVYRWNRPEEFSINLDDYEENCVKIREQNDKEYYNRNKKSMLNSLRKIFS